MQNYEISSTLTNRNQGKISTNMKIEGEIALTGMFEDLLMARPCF